MGLGGISIWQLLIIALIIVLLFGTKKLRTLGSDLGGALKGFRQAVKDDDKDGKSEPDQLTDNSINTGNVSKRSEETQDKQS